MLQISWNEQDLWNEYLYLSIWIDSKPIVRDSSVVFTDNSKSN